MTSQICRCAPGTPFIGIRYRKCRLRSILPKALLRQCLQTIDYVTQERVFKPPPNELVSVLGRRDRSDSSSSLANVGYRTVIENPCENGGYGIERRGQY